jgi:hypothetical protein
VDVDRAIVARERSADDGGGVGGVGGGSDGKYCGGEEKGAGRHAD